MLSAAQWRRIENILPPNRRDSAVIAALLYREFSGQSLRHTGEAYGLSRVRLHEWHGALKADSSLAKVMTAQKSPPARFTAPGAGPGTTTTRRWWPKSRRSSSPNFARRCA
jgi:hypothetical protein